MLKQRLPFVALAFLSLLAGIWTGLSRMGWEVYALPATAHHGAIMTGGFLGTLITLEKVIPLGKKILYLIPVAAAGSVLAFLFQITAFGFAVLLAASCGFALVMLYYLLTQRTLIYFLMLAGASCWVTGNALLLTEKFYPLAFPWWAGFTLFVIVAERLEIIRFLPVSQPNKNLLVVLLAVFITGALLSFHGIGNIVGGGALMCISIWLLRFDLIGVTIGKSGLTRYVAIALCSGYAAMLLTGVFWLFANGIYAYDAVVHLYFIGFVISMIYAHGPIILPGVLGILAKPFHKILYVWLALLHASLLVRIAGDVVLASDLRMIGAFATALSIVGYFMSMAVLTFRHHAKAA